MQIGIMANMIGMALVYEMLEFSGNRFFFTCVWARVYPERWHILSVLSTSGAALGSAKRRMRRARIEAHSNHNQTKSRRRIAKSFSVFRIYYLGTHAPLCVCSVSPLSLSAISERCRLMPPCAVCGGQSNLWVLHNIVVFRFTHLSRVLCEVSLTPL